MNILKLVALLLASSMAFAEVPLLINYQGMLTDGQGKPKTGTANLSFSIYDSASSTNALWGPQVFSKVPLVNGSFNIILGTTDASGDPISDSFQSATGYLQITDMGEDTVSETDDILIKPRQQILSAPYAIKSQSAVNSELLKGIDLVDLLSKQLVPSDNNLFSATIQSQTANGNATVNHKSHDFIDRVERTSQGVYYVYLKKDLFSAPPTVLASIDHNQGITFAVNITVGSVSYSDEQYNFRLDTFMPHLSAHFDSGSIKMMVHRNGSDYIQPKPILTLE